MSTTTTTTGKLNILSRLFKADNGDLSSELARYLLTLGFNEADQACMQDLAARNQEGALSAEEQEELHDYVDAGHLLALLQAKARMSLKRV
jgi:hypothetical protein